MRPPIGCRTRMRARRPLGAGTCPAAARCPARVVPAEARCGGLKPRRSRERPRSWSVPADQRPVQVRAARPCTNTIGVVSLRRRTRHAPGRPDRSPTAARSTPGRTSTALASSTVGTRLGRRRRAERRPVVGGTGSRSAIVTVYAASTRNPGDRTALRRSGAWHRTDRRRRAVDDASTGSKIAVDGTGTGGAVARGWAAGTSTCRRAGAERA